jgi:hypothetical protein
VPAARAAAVAGAPGAPRARGARARRAQARLGEPLVTAFTRSDSDALAAFGTLLDFVAKMGQDANDTSCS